MATVKAQVDESLRRPPKGTRDFYPEEMAARRYIEDVWRRVSIRHGFQEIDGPTFEALDLYKVKSGDEIVSQLFSFIDRGGRDLALRPEFTPTLARMVAARAAGLPRPIKWFSIPRCYRAEQPQKGRLREFMQWNVDFIGEASERSGGDKPAGAGTPARRDWSPAERAELECLAVCVDALREFGLDEKDFRIGWNHRQLLTDVLVGVFVPRERLASAFYLLDRLRKYDQAGREELYRQQGCAARERDYFEFIAQVGDHSFSAWLDQLLNQMGREGAAWRSEAGVAPESIRERGVMLEQHLSQSGLPDRCWFDFSIVRGLAYYTGWVFEITDRQGESRAIAGGGRYDQLIEMFGGPSLPAVGFGMGDVVLEILLRDRARLPRRLLPSPDVFIVNALEDSAPADRLVLELRRSQWDEARAQMVRPGLGVQQSYRGTRNIGKLLQEAAASGAKLAVILAPNEWGRNLVRLKNLADRSEKEVSLADLPAAIHAALATKQSLRSSVPDTQ